MTAIFDHAGSLERMGHDEQLFADMIGFLQMDGPGWQAELARGLAEQDGPRSERAAHTLKGLIANFGGTRSTTAATQAEFFARQRNWQALAEALPELNAAVDELQNALKPFTLDVNQR
ncbi:MAG TPA: Hpt domain-containing protein [Pirellulaceae bacterium]|nr:Hpt domain-containing protein [Pirellulaceae bacterium]